jgi:hypothetical protein
MLRIIPSNTADSNAATFPAEKRELFPVPMCIARYQIYTTDEKSKEIILNLQEFENKTLRAIFYLLLFNSCGSFTGQFNTTLNQGKNPKGKLNHILISTHLSYYFPEDQFPQTMKYGLFTFKLYKVEYAKFATYKPMTEYSNFEIEANKLRELLEKTITLYESKLLNVLPDPEYHYNMTILFDNINMLNHVISVVTEDPTSFKANSTQLYIISNAMALYQAYPEIISGLDLYKPK